MLLLLNVVFCGRWKATVADVITLPVKQVADVIAKGRRLNSNLWVDFIFSSEVFNKTSFHM